jgi:hypothetical protein
MGCDIHMYAERINDTGDYRAIHFKAPDWYRKLYKSNEVSEGTPVFVSTGNTLQCWDLGRNYALFAWLADVRNYGNYIRPLDRARGLPENLSHLIRKEWDAGLGDWHTPSWFTVEELVNFDYTDKKKIFGSNKLTPEQEQDFLWMFGSWHDFLKNLQKKGAVRIVFWFDN